MTKLKIPAFIAALALGVSVPIVAQADHHGGKRGKGMMFEKLDANGDGGVTKAEVEAATAARFADIDVNGDGGLTQAEMAAHHEAKRAEREARHAQRAEADPERAAKHAERKAKRAERKGDRSERRAERQAERFAEEDADGNGVISLAEFQPRAMKHFERVDADGDGVVTAAEQEAMVAKRKARREDRRGKHDLGDDMPEAPTPAIE